MKNLDALFVRKIDGITCCKGHPIPLGATLLGENQINFSINSVDAESCMLELYHLGGAEPYARIRIPDDYRIGGNYAVIVFGQDPDDLEYTWKFSGKMDREKGYRFDASLSLLDPYARLISGREIWGEDPKHRRPLRCRVIREDFAWEGDTPLELPFSDLVIYELHVRGFTQDRSSSARHKGTFSGVAEMIPYLKELGVNCVELLPVFEFDELENTRLVDGVRLYNYWGYSTVDFFAPKSAYASSGKYGMAADEMKNMSNSCTAAASK